MNNFMSEPEFEVFNTAVNSINFTKYRFTALIHYGSRLALVFEERSGDTGDVSGSDCHPCDGGDNSNPDLGDGVPPPDESTTMRSGGLPGPEEGASGTSDFGEVDAKPDTTLLPGDDLPFVGTRWGEY